MRLHTDLNNRPLKQTRTNHNHSSDEAEDIDCKLLINEIKEPAKQTTENPRTIIADAFTKLPRSSGFLMPSKETLTRKINYRRSYQLGDAKSKLKNRQEIIIPEELKFTYSGHQFVLIDTGEDDKDRMIILASDENIKYLNSVKMWCIDGTFDISPSLFKQLFTINVLLNGRNLPLLNAFLVDKLEKTYRRLFYFIKEFVHSDPEYIICDFEKGILNAVEFFFSKSQISGCWFHLAPIYTNIFNKMV
ncbi:unnamed protein product [Brachionus calyciflorus]|uniref:MULE transposase domain-containing protein n=1 Tax=Brachionus calyciflorus TaxID=104777 RepID=A0A814FZI7_9BILA|nr:unnamed protein product [Brachionus calyciflorus]